MRRFALDLATQHLPEWAPNRSRAWRRFSAHALLDLWPDRLLKNRVLAFVAERGMRDEQQAAVAVRVHSATSFAFKDERTSNECIRKHGTLKAGVSRVSITFADSQRRESARDRDDELSGTQRHFQ